MSLSKPFKAALFGSTLCAVALTARADQPAWLPSAIQLPVPYEIVMYQRLGTQTHILQIRLPSDPAPRFAGWGSGLTEQGYSVDESMLFDGRLLFSGKDIESGQIAILPAEPGEHMLQVDVSRMAP